MVAFLAAGWPYCAPAIALDEWKAGDELELAVKQSIESVLEEPISHLIENARRSPTQSA